MKRLLALLLAAVMCCTFLAACQSDENSPTEPTKEKPEPDDGELKIMIIGHSLGNDSAYMYPNVYKNETGKDITVGMLYHSGCRLSQHVSYLKNDAAQYAYFEFNTAKDTSWRRADCNGNFSQYVSGSGNDIYIEDGSIAQTMQYAIRQQDWDIVVLQAGVFEAANVAEASYTPNIAGDIKTVIDYVLENDPVKATTPKFAWNMTWTCPSDDTLLNESYHSALYGNFKDSQAMYEKIAATLKDVVVPSYDFDYVMPSGTAIQNAESSYLEARDLYRDTIHAKDFGRLIVSYIWYCTMTGTDINDCTFGAIPSANLVDAVSRNTGVDFVLTEEQKQILIESVTNALANPYGVTQSQYTGA